MKNTEIWIDRKDFRNTRVVAPALSPLEDGEIRVEIDKFALTSNNVSYAVSGDMIGYWNYFPTDEDMWGFVPVWGMANVIESNCGDIAVGERLYGFFPMSRYLTLQPGKIKTHYFMDNAAHRRPLPALYNQYMRCQAEDATLQSLEDERCIFFPLFMTAFVIADLMEDNDWFGADQIIVGSASSKTGFGTAAFIKENGYQGTVVGLTSNRNKDFVHSLNICDQVVTYDQVDALDQVTSVYIDMSGDARVRLALHTHLKDFIKSSQIVGATHWEDASMKQQVPGVTPVFFFAPAQIDKRNKDWGAGVMTQKGYKASAALALRMQGQLAVERHQGADALNALWQDMLDNKISGQRGIMVSL